MSAKTFRDMVRELGQNDDYWTDLAILEFTEVLIKRMQDQDITRTELASRVGKSKAYITKVLQGDNNFTIATMVNLIRALGGRLQVGDYEAAASTPTWDRSRVNPAILTRHIVGAAWVSDVPQNIPAVAVVKEQCDSDEQALSAA